MTDWYQQALTPPEVLELRMRVGVIPERDHVQALVELVDPMTSIQLAQWSVPHMQMDSWLDLLDRAHAKAKEYLAGSLEPF